MRRLIISLFVLVVLVVAAVVVGDLVTVHLTESAIAKRIEQRVPGSHATVSISSQPFLVRLADSGTVEELTAHVTGVAESGYTFNSIDVDVHGLRVNKSDLFHGSVHLDGITNATITATLPGDELVKAGVVAGLHQLGVLGPTSKATVKAGTNDVVINFDGTTITLPLNGLVSCVGNAVFVEGNLVLTCTTTTLPPALADQAG